MALLSCFPPESIYEGMLIMASTDDSGKLPPDFCSLENFTPEMIQEIVDHAYEGLMADAIREVFFPETVLDSPLAIAATRAFEKALQRGNNEQPQPVRKRSPLSEAIHEEFLRRGNLK